MQTRITNRWYDSLLTLSGREPFLELQVRVYAHRVEPEGGEGRYAWRGSDGQIHHTRYVAWGDEWDQWRQDLKDVVEQAWNRHLWLVPNHGPIQNPLNLCAAFPNLACRLRILLVSSSENPHVRVDCRQLHPEEAFLRSSMGGPTTSRVQPCWERFTRGVRETVSGRYETNHGDLDSADLKPKATGQIPAAHEFGHYIGLSHVACMSNASECYGTPGTWAYDDLMGGGTRIEPWHGRPWLWRLGQHLGYWSRLYDWHVTSSRPPRQRPPDGGFCPPRRPRRLAPGGVGGLDGGV